jgi:hypothetical protein
LIFETHHLTADYASVLEANRVGDDWDKKSKNYSKGGTGAQNIFHDHSPGNISVTRFSKSRLLLQAGEAEQLSDALEPGKVVAR